jgi:Ser/Thr protein kinase RdoA (MazF antagonist)
MPDNAARLLRRWDLGEVEPVPQTARFVTSAGPVVLRATELSRAEALLLHRVQAALAGAGLPVAAPLPTRDGRTLISAEGRRYALYPWIDGRQRSGLDLSLRQCHELGALLGRLHAELDRALPPVQQTFLVPAPRAADAVAAADLLLGSLPEPRDDFDALAERQLAERRAMLLELADHRPPEAEAVIAGYVHGGFAADRIRYGKVGVVGVFGWERLGTAPLAGELVRAAALLFGYGDDRGLDLDRVAAFVRGHAAEFELDADQIRSAAHRLWWERLCDVAERSPGAAALVRWWTAHLEHTLDVFAAAYTAAPPALEDDEILEVS